MAFFFFFADEKERILVGATKSFVRRQVTTSIKGVSSAEVQSRIKYAVFFFYTHLCQAQIHTSLVHVVISQEKRRGNENLDGNKPYSSSSTKAAKRFYASVLPKNDLRRDFPNH